ncbi:ECF RNA polymerase sigma-E factor [Kordia sp. SMS9]|uniref:RNA polymerase sigma factor n=1 Tax=Kordia sp. SMS9 TaxID=2282170 RepID=UPI000E0CE519|nr:RNA polymerase sigma factor [Kordia sp. SMS9]AXG68348.1 ECF RNA polymerase sigma-E factor [Kordia sp. SMS9]
MELTEHEFLTKITTHKGILHKVSRMYFEDANDREDLVQEIILQLWKSLKSFNGNSQFSSWMYRVALNTAIVFFKKEKRKPDTYKMPEHVQLAHEEYSDEKEEQLAIFYKAVQQLNKIEKALIFQFIEGFSGEEMAKNLGMSPVNVRVKLNRTKKKLKEIIKTQHHGF